jgi:hypothetical protein
MLARIMGSTINRHYLIIIGTLPALLRGLAYKKAQFTPMILYLGKYKSYTMINFVANYNIGFAVHIHEITRIFFIWLIISSYVGSYVKGSSIKDI